MFFKIEKKRLFYALSLLIPFLILAYMVDLDAEIIKKIDLATQNLLGPLNGNELAKILTITSLGGPEVSTLLALLLCIVIYRVYGIKDAIWATSTIIFSNLVCFLVKNLVERLRPSDKLVYESGYSFPSGHTFGTAIFVFLLIFMIIPKLKNNLTITVVKFVGIVWVLMIALTRIYLHVHYPTDTLGSILLAGFMWQVCVMIGERINGI